MKTLLIMDDDLDTLEMLGYIAESHGVEVVLRDTAISIAEIQAINPGLILCDHWLGDRFGGELCREIKSNPLTKFIPLYLLSAASGLKSVAKDNFADGYIDKPFDIDDINALLDRYLK